MKCQNGDCLKQAHIFIMRRDRLKNELYYCSSSCAQNHTPYREQATKSEKMEKSSSEERGEMSHNTSNSENMTSIENALQKPKLTREQMRKNGIIEIKNDTENLHGYAETGESKMKERETENDMKQNTLPSSSAAQSSNLSAEKSEQMSLIDESIKSTHSFAKKVMAKVESENEVIAGNVNAVCNVVKQLSSLLRLKLDANKFYQGKTK